MNTALVVSILLTHLPRTTYCIVGRCNKDDWWLLENRRKFLLVDTVYPRNFKASKEYCEERGGQLIIINSSGEQLQIKQLLKDKGGCPITFKSFYLGLYKDTDKQHTYWINGTELGAGPLLYGSTQRCEQKYSKGRKCLKRISGNYTWNNAVEEGENRSSDYQKWVRFTYPHLACAVVDICGTDLWFSAKCTDSFGTICEAYLPCASRPVLKIKGKRLENTDLTITNEQDVDVVCYLRGYADLVTRVKLTFNGSLVRSGIRSVSKSFHIDIKMHHAKFGCEAHLNTASVEVSGAMIVFQTRPRLVNESDNYQNVTRKEGGRVYLGFDIYANPQPVSYTMTRKGALVSNAEHFVTVHSLKKTFYYFVTIEMNRVSAKQTGKYVMIIENGILENLMYVFRLEVITLEEESGNMPIFIGVGILILGSIVIATSLVKGRTDTWSREDLHLPSMAGNRSKQEEIEHELEEESSAPEEHTSRNVQIDSDFVRRPHGHYRSTEIQ